MSEPNRPELLPCPFCGGEAILVDDTPDNDTTPYFYIRCVNYCASTKIPEEYCRLQIAVDSWNSRVPAAPQWTTEPPQEEGWYWVANMQSSHQFPKAAKVFYTRDGCLLANCAGHITPVSVMKHKDFFWMPIIMPPLPERKENEI